MAKVRREYFYVDPEQDADLLAWLEQQENKSQAIRAAIRAVIREVIEKSGRPDPEPVASMEAFRAVLREELSRVALSAGNGAEDEPGDVANSLDSLGL